MSNIHPMRPKGEPERQSGTGRPANENLSGTPSLVPTAPAYSDWLRNGDQKTVKPSSANGPERRRGAASYIGYATLAAVVALIAYLIGGPVAELMGPVTVSGQD